MAERNIIVYIQDLDISDRGKRVLMRRKIRTLNELENRGSEYISAVPGIDNSSICELKNVLKHVEEIFAKFEARQQRINEIFDDIKDFDVDEIHLSNRALNSLKRTGIFKVGDVIRMSQKDIMELRNVGVLTRDDITAAINAIILEGKAYFTRSHLSAMINGGIDCAVSSDRPAEMEELTETAEHRGKGFDFRIIDILAEKFFFKPVRMAEWFGLSRQGIYNALDKRSLKRRDVWTGKELREQECNLLKQLIWNNEFDYSDDQVICCCMNNRQDDLVCLFIYKDEIKCFFLKDLPEELQKEIISTNYHKYTERELSGEAAGRIVHVMRKPYFLPTFPEKFRVNAQLRNMSLDDYAIFISGYPVGDQKSVTDDQITTFFDKNLVDGKVYLSSDPRNQWIRSLASRNGYTIKDFIEMFGYESKFDGTELTTDGARERHIEELKQYVVRDNVVYFPAGSRIYRLLQTYACNKGTTINEYLRTLGFERTAERPDVAVDVLEKDMEVRQSDGKFEDKVFAQYPLVGSRILKSETLDKLNENSRKYIDTILRDPRTKLPLRAEMQITLALINNAKNWKNEENSNFWNYISLQFGYRDVSGSVVRLLQDSLENAMKKNHRLFIEDSNGRAFKSTAVIHALTTRKSWMALFDFLFDFYKNNLKWKIIPGDPLIAVMIRSLQQKLAGEGNEDTELTISSRVYSFQEGIRKLVLLRPLFTRGLFEKLISKIDIMVNSGNKLAKTYEEQLCEEWFKEKITAIANTKRTERPSQGGQRDVAIDYSRVRAKYILKDEKDIRLVLPDIRLKSEEVGRAVIIVYYNGIIACQQNMSWYGNELGKTLNGVSLSLPAIPAIGAESMNIQVRIICDNEEIYNSDDALNRRIWIFYGGNECNASQIKKDNYTVVLPRTIALETENAEITEIDRFKNSGLQAFFLELKDGYVVAANGRLIAFDNENGTDIRVIAPSESASLPRVEVDGQEYCFAYQNSVCSIIFGSRDFLQQFVILRDGERTEFSSLPTSNQGLVFMFPLSGDKDTCRLQVINLADERLMFDRSFILIKHASCSFNREFYYSSADYQNAVYRVDIDGFSKIMPFDADAEEVRIPFRNGELHVAIPKIEVQENSGIWMNGFAPAWYIGNIPQTSLLRVSTPPKVEVRFLVGGKDIMYDGQGLVTIGNVLQSFCNTENFLFADVQMNVSGIKQNSTYSLARVFYKERFLGRPEFWTEEQKLYWNQGGTFIGKPGRTFTLSLYSEMDTLIEFKLDENTEFVEIPEDMPIGNYRYEISILSGGLFKKVKEVIAEGDCVVGDQNLLRFRERRIVVDFITDEFNERAGHIPIRTCYIDKIEFQGMEDTSEGHCPVYSGVMYTTGDHGERYEFSFARYTNKRSVTKMMVNPVRIVYISEAALCITDSDGDGLYYYRYYDKYLENTVYALTDQEYTKQNKHTYANADLYSYRTERI